MLPLWPQHPRCTIILPTDTMKSCRSVQLILPLVLNRSRWPNPAVRDGIVTPVGATGSKVRFARHSGSIQDLTARSHLSCSVGDPPRKTTDSRSATRQLDASPPHLETLFQLKTSSSSFRSVPRYLCRTPPQSSCRWCRIFRA